jgi:glyoxylase-like metal-dependent hydrolase (beta-lactamase superfamily II)
MAKCKIFPLSTGSYDEAELSQYYYLPDPNSAGFKLKIEYWMFLIDAGDTLILVDTGPGDPETWGRSFHHFYDRTPEQVPSAALNKLGIKPFDIDIIINTHLHWTSCQGNALFPRATIFIQEDEITQALNPVLPHLPYYTPVYASPPWIQTLSRSRIIKGTTKIIDGVTAMRMPSHTMGFQSVMVETFRGPILIAGEMCPFFDNWTGRWRMPHVPSGILQASLQDYYACFQMIEEINPHYVLPGLDPKVSRQEVYGAQV